MSKQNYSNLPRPEIGAFYKTGSTDIEVRAISVSHVVVGVFSKLGGESLDVYTREEFARQFMQQPVQGCLDV